MEQSQIISKRVEETEKKIFELNNVTEAIYYQQMFVTQFLLINGMFDQYTLNISLLSDIVHSAQLGKIHSSILAQAELVESLKEIKMTLPS